MRLDLPPGGFLRPPLAAPGLALAPPDGAGGCGLSFCSSLSPSTSSGQSAGRRGGSGGGGVCVCVCVCVGGLFAQHRHDLTCNRLRWGTVGRSLHHTKQEKDKKKNLVWDEELGKPTFRGIGLCTFGPNGRLSGAQGLSKGMGRLRRSPGWK